MLTTGRKVGEKIAIYNKETGELLAYVELRGLRGDHARIGVQAPKEIGVDRWEVFCEREGMEVSDGKG